MRPVVQKTLASIGGVAIFLGSLIWAFHSSGFVSQLLDFKVGLASEFPDGDAVYKKFADIYTMLSVVGVALAAGLSFALLLWERRPRRVLLEVVFWILLALALPMTVINYWSADIFVSRSQQALLNIILCFLGLVCLRHLLFVSVDTASTIVLKGLSILFLSFQAVFVPAIYTVLWWLNWEKAISLADSKSFAPGWITSISGLGALAVSVLQYRIAASKDRREQGSTDAGIIIVERKSR